MVEVATQSVAGKSLKNSGTLVLHQERVAENKTPVGWFQTPGFSMQIHSQRHSHRTWLRAVLLLLVLH